MVNNVNYSEVKRSPAEALAKADGGEEKSIKNAMGDKTIS